MEMNLQTKNIGAGPSSTSAEDGVHMIPVAYQPGNIQPKEARYNQKGFKLYPPSPLLWAPVSPPISHDQRIGAGVNSDHTIIVPEPHVCRICDLDEEENDEDVLVELGCSCRGQMSRMHRKCILKWYGVRMILEKSFKCELCNTVLHPEAQLIVVRGVTDHENGGRAILLKALKSALASYAPHIDVESAATYQELVHLLLVENAVWSRLQRQIVIQNAAQDADSHEDQPQPRPPACSRGPLVVTIGATAFAVGLYTYLIHHFYGNIEFH